MMPALRTIRLGAGTQDVARMLSPFACPLALLLVPACTFNVDSFERDVRSESEPTTFTRLRVDVRPLAATLDGGEIVVRGADRTTANVLVRVGGLLGAQGNADMVASGVDIDWTDAADGTRALSIAYDGPAPDNVWLERIELELPLGAELDLSADAQNVDVEGLDGAVSVLTDVGSILVRGAGTVSLETGAGRIDVEAQRGVLTTGFGSIEMAMVGEVEAHTQAGEIDGSFGLGGELSTASGSIDVALATPLDRDLSLTSQSGAIILRVPAGAAFELDTMVGSGTVIVETGDVSHSGGDYDGPIGGGGPFVVRAESEGGPIHVLDDGGA
jgi:hypothetical protein